MLVRGALRRRGPAILRSFSSSPSAASHLLSTPLLEPSPNSRDRATCSRFTVNSQRRWMSTGGIVEFKLADIGEGIAEVELLQWFINEGDTVKQFDRICEVQSDKATVEITSRYDGVIKTVNGEVGDMISVGATLVDIQVKEGVSHTGPVQSIGSDVLESENKLSVPSSVPASAPAAAPATPASAPTINRDKVLTTPSVRKIAKENNVDLATVPGSGPKGRILKEDILAFVGGSVSPLAATTSTPASNVAPRAAAPSQPLAEDREEPIRGYGRLMVKSMNQSLTIPHFGYDDEISMDAISDLRNSLKPEGERHGIKVSFMPIMIKAASMALSEFPIVNSSISADESKIFYHGDHNIGIAMDTPRGLIVPNIKQCQHKTILDIAADLNRLQEAGSSGNMPESDLANTTFSLSNIGAIGGTYMSPVIASPQVAIGALGKIQTLPRFDADDNVVKAKIMNVSWAGDHRVIDGATMARFSNLWKDYIENPHRMLGAMK